MSLRTTRFIVQVNMMGTDELETCTVWETGGLKNWQHLKSLISTAVLCTYEKQTLILRATCLKALADLIFSWVF